MLAGEAGGSLRELMDRMGQSTTRAALIYQYGAAAGVVLSGVNPLILVL